MKRNTFNKCKECLNNQYRLIIYQSCRIIGILFQQQSRSVPQVVRLAQELHQGRLNKNRWLTTADSLSDKNIILYDCDPW